MQGRQKLIAGTLIAVPTLLPISNVLAEEAFRTTLVLGERLRSVNESGFTTPQDEGTSAVTTLSFGLLSETGTQTLALDLDTFIPIYLDGETNENSSYTLEDPSARLFYSLESRSSLLTLITSYRRSDVGTSNFLDETLDEDVATGGGQRTLTSFRPRLTLGRDGPVTADFGYQYLRSTYSDADPGLSDSTTEAGDARVTFRLSPLASAFVFTDYRFEDRDLATSSDRTTSSYGVGANYDISPVTTVTGQVSYDTDETEGGINAPISNDGLGYRLGLIRAVSSGTYSLDASSTETIDGYRHNASFGRSINLARGQLTFRLGAVKNEGLDIEPLANVGLNYNLSDTSRINLTLSQNSVIDDNDNNAIRTRLNMSYNYQVNTLSSLTAALRIASDNELGVDAEDESTLEASLRYNHDVGADWDFVSGVSYRTEQRDNRADRNTSTIFVGLEKRFDWRP